MKNQTHLIFELIVFGLVKMKIKMWNLCWSWVSNPLVTILHLILFREIVRISKSPNWNRNMVQYCGFCSAASGPEIFGFGFDNLPKFGFGFVRVSYKVKCSGLGSRFRVYRVSVCCFYCIFMWQFFQKPPFSNDFFFSKIFPIQY